MWRKNDMALKEQFPYLKRKGSKYTITPIVSVAKSAVHWGFLFYEHYGKKPTIQHS